VGLETVNQAAKLTQVHLEKQNNKKKEKTIKQTTLLFIHPFFYH
jgi:hypothetical protein